MTSRASWRRTLRARIQRRAKYLGIEAAKEGRDPNDFRLDELATLLALERQLTSPDVFKKHVLTVVIAVITLLLVAILMCPVSVAPGELTGVSDEISVSWVSERPVLIPGEADEAIPLVALFVKGAEAGLSLPGVRREDFAIEARPGGFVTLQAIEIPAQCHVTARFAVLYDRRPRPLQISLSSAQNVKPCRFTLQGAAQGSLHSGSNTVELGNPMAFELRGTQLTATAVLSNNLVVLLRQQSIDAVGFESRRPPFGSAIMAGTIRVQGREDPYHLLSGDRVEIEFARVDTEHEAGPTARTLAFVPLEGRTRSTALDFIITGHVSTLDVEDGSLMPSLLQRLYADSWVNLVFGAAAYLFTFIWGATQWWSGRS